MEVDPAAPTKDTDCDSCGKPIFRFQKIFVHIGADELRILCRSCDALVISDESVEPYEKGEF